MASETEIANLALAHLGQSQFIQDLTTEKSQPAAIMRRFFDQARDEALRAAPWPFAAKFATLALVVEDPTTEWEYSYRYPADCVRFRRILGGSRKDTRDEEVEYRIAQDTGGRTILTDEKEAVGEYTKREEDTSLWPADFVDAMSLLLAWKAAPSITAGDPFKLGDRAFQLYLLAVGTAKAAAANEERLGEPPDSEFIRERG